GPDPTILGDREEIDVTGIPGQSRDGSSGCKAAATCSEAEPVEPAGGSIPPVTPHPTIVSDREEIDVTGIPGQRRDREGGRVAPFARAVAHIVLEAGLIDSCLDGCRDVGIGPQVVALVEEGVRATPFKLAIAHE